MLRIYKWMDGWVGCKSLWAPPLRAPPKLIKFLVKLCMYRKATLWYVFRMEG